MTISREDQKHMKAAIEQAKLDQRIHKVGARIVKDGECLAESHGVEGGGQHAEFMALKTCEDQGKYLVGATLYTTLEPCRHVRSHDKTDCAVRVFNSGIEEVVVGMLDPDERVCSRGWNYLKQNGVRVRRFPERLRKRIEDLNIDFIETKAVGANARIVHRLLTFTESGSRRPVLGFANDLTPDLADIRALAKQYKTRPVMPLILWPPANEALWRNVLGERQKILESIRVPAVDERTAKFRNRDFEWINYFIEDAWKIRTRAAARIPKMWRGMAPYWGQWLADSFEKALESFLIFCNTNVLLALARTEKAKARPLCSPARKWVKMVSPQNPSLSPVHQEVFNSRNPFYQVAVSKLGDWHPDPDVYVYVPASEAMLMRETYQRINHISSKYTVPSVEFVLIGEKTSVKYGLGEWRRILDEHGEDARLLPDSSLLVH